MAMKKIITSKKTKKQDPPQKRPSYTASDSAQYEAIGKRLDKNIGKLNKAPVRKSGGMEFSSGLDVDMMPTMRKQMDSMVRNPYFPTAKARADVKKAKTGGMKATKPPVKATMSIEKKIVPKTKQMMKFESKVVPKTKQMMKFESKVVPKSTLKAKPKK
jgi:hypothetical protein